MGAASRLRRAHCPRTSPRHWSAEECPSRRGDSMIFGLVLRHLQIWLNWLRAASVANPVFVYAHVRRVCAIPLVAFLEQQLESSLLRYVFVVQNTAIFQFDMPRCNCLLVATVCFPAHRLRALLNSAHLPVKAFL